MKLPFEFGIKLIFRLVLPGFLLTVGLYPAIVKLREIARWTISVEYLLIFSVIITGWLLLTLDQPIYMFLEGRRFWPSRIRAIFIWTEHRRLTKLRTVEDKFYELSEASTRSKKQNYRQRYAEASVEKRKFPLDQNGQPEARFPTRLGNLIDSYESYPANRYGVQSIFHWYRLWLNLDKDLREELDNRQALADSSVYASVALFISGLLWLAYWSLWKVGFKVIGDERGEYALWLAIGLVVISYLMYRAALYPQSQYGESFKSVFDVYEKKIDVTRVVERVADLTYNSRILNQTREQQLKAAWRYLHNYTVKCPEPECSFRYPMSPTEYRIHYQEKHELAADTPQRVPDFGPYRQNLKHAYTHEKVILGLKVLGIGLGLLLLGAGLYQKTNRFAVIAIIASLLAITLETWIRNRQNRYTDATFNFESRFQVPHIYKNPSSNYTKAAQLLLPYVLVLVTAMVLLILGYARAGG